MAQKDGSRLLELHGSYSSAHAMYVMAIYGQLSGKGE